MNTPRTDAARWQLVCHFDQGGEYDANPKRANDGDWVPVEICQQLETELAAMTAMANRLAEALDFTMNGNTAKDQIPFIDASREALAAYENYKKGNTL